MGIASVISIFTVHEQSRNGVLVIQLYDVMCKFIIFISGKCDSYVKIRLLPEEKFVEIKPQKTHVQKETLFPLYDETFNMSVNYYYLDDII